MPIKTEIIDTLTVYSQIVGLGERRFPTMEEFPTALALPSNFLGSFFEAIRATTEDNMERSQAILWNSSTQSLNHSPITRGSGSMVISLREVMRTYFGSKALLHYHTHPKDPDSKDSTWHKDFSLIDIASMKAHPRIAYISAVGSDLGGVFAFQTNESARLPKSHFLVYLKTLFEAFIVQGAIENQKVRQKYGLAWREPLNERILWEMAMNAADNIRVTKGGCYLENSGFGCYTWTPTTSIDENPVEIVLKKLS